MKSPQKQAKKSILLPKIVLTINYQVDESSCLNPSASRVLKFIYSEKATKFCEIFSLLLTTALIVKSKGKNSQNFVAFSEYMNFI